MKKAQYIGIFIAAITLAAGILYAIPSPRLLPENLLSDQAYHPQVLPVQTARADSAHGFDVQKYVITLDIDHTNQYIEGNVVATVQATEQLSSISYELAGLSVSSVLVNGSPTTFTHTNNLLTISLSMSQGQVFNTTVFYHGNPILSPDVYQIGMRFSPTYIFTISDPDAGRYWWPSYDHPWDKAVVDLHITMRDDWKVAANGIRSAIVDNADGTHTTSWLGEHPMTTYLVCITAAPYQEINQTALDGELPVQNFVLSSQYNNAMSDLANLPDMIDYYSQIFGEYPFEKYGNATVNMSTFGAMEHQTMTTLGNYIINGQGTYELTIAHELAHQWFGNAVSFLDFDDVWLSEGFATYSEHLWKDYTDGWQAAVDYVNSSYHQYYINWENAYGQTPSIYNPSFNNYFSPPSYEKAASVLHMLRYKIGNDAFFQLLQTWFDTYKYGNVITDEFQAMAEDISGQDLEQFFQQWIYGSGIPSIQYARWEGFLGDYNIKIEARSTSPTATDFIVDFPIHFDQGPAGDSLRVIASPGGHFTYHNLAAIEGHSALWIPHTVDPNHWILSRGYEMVRPQLRQALPANNQVRLFWDSYQNWGAVSYSVWRSLSGAPPEMWEYLTTTTELHYEDHTAQPGVMYDYWIHAIDLEGMKSDASNRISVTLVPFSFEENILVVDETRDGTGASISPTDQMVDDYYNAVLGGFEVDHWDIESQGFPSLQTLGSYRLVLWHSDDFSQIQIPECLDDLASYVHGGGKLIISGWKTASSLWGFNSDFCPGFDQANYSSSAIMLSAVSDTYPELLVDPDKLTPTWNGRLPMISTFENVDAIYMLNTGDDSEMNNQPVAFVAGPDDSYVFLGFPLYFMQADGVQDLLADLIYELIGVVSNASEELPAPAFSLNAYPNPFNPSTTISYELPLDAPVEITIYNMRGQIVKRYSPGTQSRGMHSLSFDGLDQTGRQLASGVYTIRISAGEARLSKRISLIK